MKKILILAVCAVVCCGSIMAAKRQYCYAGSKGKVPKPGSTLAIVVDDDWAEEGTKEYREQCNFLYMAIGAVKSKGYKITGSIPKADYVLLIRHGVDLFENHCVRWIEFADSREKNDSYRMFCYAADLESESSFCIPYFTVFDRLLIGAALDKGILFGAPKEVQWDSDDVFIGVSKTTMKKMRKYQEKYRSFRYEH